MQSTPDEPGLQSRTGSVHAALLRAAVLSDAGKCAHRADLQSAPRKSACRSAHTSGSIHQIKSARSPHLLNPLLEEHCWCDHLRPLPGPGVPPSPKRWLGSHGSGSDGILKRRHGGPWLIACRCVLIRDRKLDGTMAFDLLRSHCLVPCSGPQRHCGICLSVR